MPVQRPPPASVSRLLRRERAPPPFVILSERSPSLVILSERSESKDLHLAFQEFYLCQP